MIQKRACEKMENKIKKKSRASKRKSIRSSAGIRPVLSLKTKRAHKRALIGLIMRVKLIEICPSPTPMVEFQY